MGVSLLGMKKLRFFLKKAINRVFRQSINSTPTSVDFYIQNGNLKAGKNCDLSGLSINIVGAKKGFLNVVIGDDCFLSGTLALYSGECEIVIGNRVFIGPNTMLFAYKKINIEDDVMVSWGCTLIDTNAHSLKSQERLNDVLDWKKGPEMKNWKIVESKAIHVESNVWIGFNSIITKGVRLGKACIVASGSVVTKSVNANIIVGGNPAKFIKETC